MESNKREIRISIIIPSYNQGQFLERTLQSVIQQNYSSTEIIVLDGGSTDDSVDIIKRYEKYISYWRSSKDNGQSAAINEGLRMATGDFVTWLNSDDILLPNTLDTLNECSIKHPDIRWFLGNVIWMNKDEYIIQAYKTESYCSFLAKRCLFSNGGPSTFMRRDIIRDYGYLREDFDFSMDTEYWYRLSSQGEKFMRIQIFCWGLRLHEAAKMSGHNFKNSSLANPEHPSWRKKTEEFTIINNLYLKGINPMIHLLYIINKLFDFSIFSRISNLYLKGKKIK